MANSRDSKVQGKEEQARKNPEAERSQEAREAMKRRRGFLLILGAILIAGLIVVFFWLRKTGQDPLGGPEEGTVVDDPVDGFILDQMDAQSLTPFAGSYLLRLSPNRLSVLNLEGAEEFSFSLRIDKPAVTAAGDYILVYAPDGYNYYLVQPSGVIYEGKTHDPIVTATLNSKGQAALLLDAPETHGLLRVMEPSGRHLFDYRLRDRMRSGYLLTMNFAEAEPFLDLSLINTDGTEPRPLIHRFDLETAKLMEIYQPDSNEALPVLAQGVGGDLLAIGSHTVWRREGNVMKPWFETARIHAALPCQSGACILASETVDGPTRLYYLKFSSQAEALSELPSVALDGVPQLFVANHNFVAAASDETVFLCNVHTMATERYDLNSTILRISIDERGRILVVTKDRVIRL